MKRTVLAAALIFTILFGSGAAHAAYTYTTLSGPSGTASMQVEGIGGNNVVGYYRTSTTGPDNGFVYNISTGAYTTVNVPGATYTDAYGVSGNGYVVGNSGTGAFLYNGSNYTALSTPGVTLSRVNGTDGSTVVGNSSNSAAFVYNISTNAYSYLSGPSGAIWSGANGISGSNVVGNWYPSSYKYQGFLYNGSTYTTLSVPGATGTYAEGISGNEIAGYYNNNTTGYNGFLYNISTGTYTTFNVPGSTYTYLYGINANGDLVGTTHLSGQTYAFLATPAPVPIPAGILLLAPGLAGLAALRRKHIG